MRSVLKRPPDRRTVSDWITCIICGHRNIISSLSVEFDDDVLDRREREMADGCNVCPEVCSRDPRSVDT